MESNTQSKISQPLLNTIGVRAGYGRNEVLHDINLSVSDGEVVALIGANGAGKTTLMSTIIGRIQPSGGDIKFRDQSLLKMGVQERVRLGLALVPEGREPLKPMSVEDNLLVARSRVGEKAKQSVVDDQLETIYELFPRLKERYKQQAGSMSGGEQQMLAIGRALMSEPDLLLLDEPSLGLAPTIVDSVFEALEKLKATGLAMLLVEQDAFLALDFADRGYVLETGNVVLQGPTEEVSNDPMVMASYLGM